MVRSLVWPLGGGVARTYGQEKEERRKKKRINITKGLPSVWPAFEWGAGHAGGELRRQSRRSATPNDHAFDIANRERAFAEQQSARIAEPTSNLHRPDNATTANHRLVPLPETPSHCHAASHFP